MVRRWLSPLAIACLLVHGVLACAENLNPQPLPPEDPDRSTTGNPSQENGGGNSPAPSADDDSTDAATAADARDGGDAGGDT